MHIGEVVGSTPILSTINLALKVPQGAFFMSYHVYILYSVKLDKYYTGSCENVGIRIQQHNTGRNKSTKAGIPWIIKCIEEYNTRTEAVQRESEIKNKKSRKYIEWLISSAG